MYILALLYKRKEVSSIDRGKPAVPSPAKAIKTQKANGDENASLS